ncbi:MAG: Cobyrinic acid A,C-diamide synthase [Acidobacteriaceae bacterium]|nr:Cobyrinic acid A,C-diamide synthase [Acidobacteriaceae bacterium]
MKAFLIAGTASGVGKTTVALAIMAAFRRRGLVVQPFKCGPDFLDTKHHSEVCNRSSRNLDTWMLNADANRAVFCRACVGADVAVVEGMMGLFDAVTGDSDAGSSAEIAKLLKLPIVLVVDASKSARSVAAVVRGFEVFDPELNFAGVILNGVAGQSHFRLLKNAIQSGCETPVLGWLLYQSEITIQERHLGLEFPAEQSNSENKVEILARLAEEHLNLDVLLDQLSDLAEIQVARGRSVQASVRIGVARDQAFSFYYQDNMDLLREAGAEIVEFSPLNDRSLPADLDALYFGGGYPELYAEQLSENIQMQEQIRAFAKSNRPIYAECGGLIYLSRGISTNSGCLNVSQTSLVKKYSMIGLLPIDLEMTDSLVDFGYVDVEFTSDCLLGPKGTIVRGHSFHFSRIAVRDEISTAYNVTYSLSGQHGIEGYTGGNLLASYVHIHFGADPALATSFVDHVSKVKHELSVAA